MIKDKYPDFVVFICTHGRPDSQHTLKALRQQGYTGKIWLLLDNEDETSKFYHHNLEFCDDIVWFNKQHFIDQSDIGTNEDHRKCILYAKNACEYMANKHNLPYFVIADDDILKFRYRYVEDGKLKTLDVTDMDKVIEYYIDYMLNTDTTATGFGFTQFYFHGVESFKPYNMLKYRVPYNFVFRNAKHEVNWRSWFGEDIITAVYNGRLGQVWSALPQVQQEIVALATASGGMKDTYDSNSSIKLAMQNVMYLPSELKPYYYKGKFMASIKRENAFPMILSSCYQK